MGPENNGSPFAVYIDGQRLPEITPGHWVDSASEAEVEAITAAAMAWTGEAITVEVAAVAGTTERFAAAVELATAEHLARKLEPVMVSRYLHTKKKRTRKKYEKRLRAWFKEEILQCRD